MTEHYGPLQPKDFVRETLQQALTSNTSFIEASKAILEMRDLLGTFCIGGLIKTRDTDNSSTTLYKDAPIIIFPRRLRLQCKETERKRKKRSLFYIMTCHGVFGLEIRTHEKRPLIGRQKNHYDVAKAIQRSLLRDPQDMIMNDTHIRYQLSRPEEIALHGNKFSPTHEKYRIIAVHTKKQRSLFLRAVEKNMSAVS